MSDFTDFIEDSPTTEAHVINDTKHREINDLASGSTNLWSGQKITSELNTISGGSGVNQFTKLLDTPNSYDDGKYLQSTFSGTEWATISGADSSDIWGKAGTIISPSTTGSVLEIPDLITAGIEWTTSSGITTNSWYSVTYGNGIFVAISGNGFGNRVMTSPDGVNWTIRVSAADNFWFGVTYGNGMFVAVSNNGTNDHVMTSPDGITWTSRIPAATNYWRSITYGNGLFVVVSYTGSGNRVMTSPDGITWTSRTSASDNEWVYVCYGNGLFVAVANSGSGNRVMTSPDGITWTSRISAADNNWNSVTYGNGLFVAVATSGVGNRVMTSPDGITWTIRTTAPDYYWRGIIYGNGIFVAVSSNDYSTGVMTSGKTELTKIPETTYTDIKNKPDTLLELIDTPSNYDDGKYLQSTSSGTEWSTISGATDIWNRTGTVISTSTVGDTLEIPDLITAGITWTSRTSAADNGWVGVAYGNGLFVAVSYGGSNRAMTSPDGVNWTSRITPVANHWRAVTYGNGLFVAVSYDGSGNRVMTSPDGITWTSRTSAADNQWRSVTYGDGLFVAVAGTGIDNRVMTSPDGINWTIRTSASDSSWAGVTYGNGLFVAVSYSGSNRVMTSPDGVNWTSRISAAENDWNSVTYGNGMFVAVANSGVGNRVMTSSDGITWVIRASIVDNEWAGVTYGNGVFVAVSFTGTGNRVMTSLDGIVWTSRISAIDNDWWGVVYGNGIFVAVSYSGVGNRVMTSGKAESNIIPSLPPVNQFIELSDTPNSYDDGKYLQSTSSGTEWSTVSGGGGAHTVASHSDTSTTGAELDTLTDNSIADILHRHSELVASDGSPDPALSVNADGKVGIGHNNPAELLHVKGADYATIIVEGGVNNTAGVSFKNDVGYWETGCNTDDSFTIVDIANLHTVVKIMFGAPTDSLVINGAGNVGAGTSSPATSAKLELNSTTGALLLTRMTTTQRDALTAVNGMVLYNTTDNKFQGRENGAWVNLI